MAAACASLICLVLSATSAWPWLGLEANIGGVGVDIGIFSQLGFTCLLASFATFSPSNTRILELEKSHRNFTMSMRDHPELAGLEPETMEVTAQMSNTTRDLATIYSDGNSKRAKDFLIQRQVKRVDFDEKISLILSVTQEIRNYRLDIKNSERKVERQMEQLEKGLREVLPKLGFELDDDAAVSASTPPHKEDDNVVQIAGKSGTYSSTDRPN